MDTGSHSVGKDDTSTDGLDDNIDNDTAATASTTPGSDEQPYEEYTHGVFDQGQPEDDDDVDEGRSVFDQDEPHDHAHHDLAGQEVYEQGHPEHPGQHGQGVYEQGHAEEPGEHGQGVFHQGHEDHHHIEDDNHPSAP